MRLQDSIIRLHRKCDGSYYLGFWGLKGIWSADKKDFQNSELR